MFEKLVCYNHVLPTLHENPKILTWASILLEIEAF